jgi:hypothetical protein
MIRSRVSSSVNFPANQYVKLLDQHCKHWDRERIAKEELCVVRITSGVAPRRYLQWQEYVGHP